MVFNCSLRYYINFSKNKPVVGFAFFVSDNRIKVPTHFIYSGFWWSVKRDTIKFRNLLSEMLEELKRNFKNIELRLPPFFEDVRPFQWAGFSVGINYTYTRCTSGLNFEYNIRSRVKKATDLNLIPAVSGSFDKVWQHQIYDLKRFHFHTPLLAKVETLFHHWWQSGFLKIYEVESEGKVVGSCCALIDPDASEAYNLLISSANSNYHTGVHAALYNFIFLDLQAQEIKEFDLYGADIAGVADFKSSFDARLRVHYTVKYNRRLALLSAFKNDMKSRMIRWRAKLF